MSSSLPAPLLVPDTEAARMLGISRAHLHRLRAAGKWGPRPIRLGRALRFDREELLAWVKSGAPDARTWQAIREQTNRRFAKAVI
ncbi:MAG TPA: helix-turn-helix domain-containing protein [Gemmataceae bacterium]|nr:helix-turn-helix domain-containing protein [Gemmataceae bacterium]